MGALTLKQVQDVVAARWDELSPVLGDADPVLLGSSSEGAAVRFGDLVLKVTTNRTETAVAARILASGKTHPNVYAIRHVLSLGEHRIGDGSKSLYGVVYDYLESASQEMREVADAFGTAYREAVSYAADLYPLFMRDWTDGTARKVIETVSEYAVDQGDVFYDPLLSFRYMMTRMYPAEFGLDSKEQVAYFVLSVVAASGKVKRLDDGLPDPAAQLRGMMETALDDSIRRQIADGIGCGLAFMARLRVSFADVYGGGVLAKHGQPVLIDFGSSSAEGGV